jgi:hypothetical protein
MKGATCYEYQIGKIGVRILRPSMYFVPFKTFYGEWRFPTIIKFYKDKS